MLSNMKGADVIACVLLTSAVVAVTLPSTPCPKLFNYIVNSNNQEVFGSLKLVNDLTGHYALQVNMSLATTTDKNIRIQRKTPWNDIENGSPIEYYIYFPSDKVFPKMTSIVFNGKLYCKGPVEEATEGQGVTPLSASDVSKRIISRSLSPDSLGRAIYHNINDPECGKKKNYEALIFSGSPTRPGEYPWLVAVFMVQGIGNYKFICGANLVSNWHVVTAAHCMKSESGKNIAKESIVLVLGTLNITNWATNSVVRAVAKYHIHPDFRSPPDADIAVLLMKDRVIFGQTIRPICIWDEDDDLRDIEGQNGTVVGWGKDEGGGNYIQVPKQSVLPVVPENKCLRADIAYTQFTSENTFCAGYIGNKRGPCSGDSGSGFYIHRDGLWKIRGIVSLALIDPYTLSCDVNKYVVFTDVAKFVPWIQTKMLEAFNHRDATTTSTDTSTPPPPLPTPTIQTHHDKCGVTSGYAPLAVSGHFNRSEKYPWLVALLTVKTTGQYKYICAGSLVSKNHVITAAHCLKFYIDINTLKDDLIVVLGQHNTKNWFIGSTIRAVKASHVHPEYKNPEGDIAVIVLDEPVSYSETIRAVCVWDEDDNLIHVIESLGRVAGWGQDESGLNLAEESRQISFSTVTTTECVFSVPMYRSLITGRTFCADFLKRVHGYCSILGGEGFVMNRDGITKLRGIVSIVPLNLVNRTCDTNTYVLFTDVSKYVTWLKEIMGSH